MQKTNSDIKTSMLGTQWRRDMEADAVGKKKKKLIKQGPLIPQAQKSTARNLLPPLSQAGGGGGVHHSIRRECPVDLV